MKKFQHNLVRQRGIAMIELSIALIIILSLAAFAYNYFSNNMRKTEVQNTVGQVITIAGAIAQQFGTTNQYGSITTALAVRSRAIPEELHSSATTANNTYGGGISVLPATMNTANDGADLFYASVPQEQCMDIVTSTQRVGRRINVNGTLVKPLNGPLNVSTLATQCAPVGGAPVTITWTIGRSGS